MEGVNSIHDPRPEAESTTLDTSVHSVKKVPGIDNSKSRLKEIVRHLFEATLAPLLVS